MTPATVYGFDVVGCWLLSFGRVTFPEGVSYHAVNGWDEMMKWDE